jgi:hypothetical protein
MNPLQKVDPTPARLKGKVFWTGVGLIFSSFGVFLLYLVIPFLSVSFEAKASIAIAAWILSWGLFSVGTLLTGKEGYRYLKQLVRDRIRKS